MVLDLFKLIRPHQWLKNLFIFLPVFFGGAILNFDSLTRSLYAFIAYSLVCSSIYCLNDIIDRKADALHPKKKFRPVACGRISVPTAWTLHFILLLCAHGVLFLGYSMKDGQENWFGTYLLICSYYALNLAYCMVLKKYALIDVMIIAVGFVLRILVGGCVTGIELSHWIIIMTFLLALFLAFAKRRDDVIVFQLTGKKPRANIVRYNEVLLNQVLSVIIAVILVAYIQYCVSPEVMHRMKSNKLYVTSIFVLLGLLRYLQITFVDGKSGSPTKVLMKDLFLQITILGWLATFMFILYF